MATKTRKIKLVIYVSPAQKAALEKLSLKTDEPTAALVRRAINALLAQKEKAA
jgi:hypothetical protein